MQRYFIYCRKSSEAEDRQVLSLESQEKEMQSLAKRMNLQIIRTITEAQSAKAPGRSLFNKMLQDIKQNRADGIICWKLDRLARNPIDGAQISWLLQKGIIKHIQTPERSYFPEDNVLLMNVEFGMANQYILDLSKNVKRGLKTKAEKGWIPCKPPPGYRNEKSRKDGSSRIIKDPDRFLLVKKLWELVLSGDHSPQRVFEIARDRLGLRNSRGRTIGRSTIYNIFSNSFYYGQFEYPGGSGIWHEGKHEPMVSHEDFDRVQILLGRKGRPRSKKRSFAFTGVLTCGECGGNITAEEKNQVICSGCRYKFSSNHRTDCPKCGLDLEKMEKPTILKYTYYHCIKKKDPACSQRYLEGRDLEQQIDSELGKIHISESFKNWALKYLKEKDKVSSSSNEVVRSSLRRSVENCDKKLENLFQMRISHLNVSGAMLSDEDYATKRATLLKEKERLQRSLEKLEKNGRRYMDAIEGVFHFACQAQNRFHFGKDDEKKKVLLDAGSNLTIRDKKLRIYWQRMLLPITRIVQYSPPTRAGFEPAKKGFKKGELERIFDNNPFLWAQLDDVRTYTIEAMIEEMIHPDPYCSSFILKCMEGESD